VLPKVESPRDFSLVLSKWLSLSRLEMRSNISWEWIDWEQLLEWTWHWN
jgi:hypothetical protein